MTEKKTGGKTIVVVATLDTRGDEVQFIKSVIEGEGNGAVVVETGVKGNTVFCENGADEGVSLEADTVVWCTGLVRKTDLADSFRDTASEVHVIGDCRELGNITGAFSDAYRAALSIRSADGRADEFFSGG
jgi:hypothetical protein